MDDGDPWRNKLKVQVIAAVDMLIGAFFLIFYFYYGVVFMVGNYEMPGQDVSPHLGRFLTVMLGFTVFILNGCQIYVALNLLKAVKFEDESAQLCKSRSRTWFKMTIFITILLIVKFFFLCLVPLGSTTSVSRHARRTSSLASSSRSPYADSTVVAIPMVDFDSTANRTRSPPGSPTKMKTEGQNSIVGNAKPKPPKPARTSAATSSEPSSPAEE